MHPADTSPALKAQVKLFEGKRPQAYFDPAGIPTAGYGHISGITSDDVNKKKVYEDRVIDQWFEEDMNRAEGAVRRATAVPLNQNQFDALSSFVFNLGPGNFGGSTLLKRLNAGKYGEVPEQIRRWDKARVGGKMTALPGLVKRRDWEAKLFATGAALPAPEAPKPTPDMTVIPAPESWFWRLVRMVLKLFGIAK